MPHAARQLANARAPGARSPQASWASARRTAGHAPLRPLEESAEASPSGHDFSRIPPVAAGLRVNERGDRLEQEADRMADAVMTGRSAQVAQSAPPLMLQRDEPRTGPPTAKPKTEAEKYEEAAKKLAEALRATEAGKQLEAKVTQFGKDFVSTTEGKAVVGTALAGALAALIATNKELPVGIPEIPLDWLSPGLKAKLTWEGPVRTPTNVGLTLTTASGVSVGASYSQTPASPGKPAEQKAGLTVTIPLGGSPSKKKGPSESEKIRAETARLAAENAKWQEAFKTDKERAEDKAFLDSYLRWKGSGLLDLPAQPGPGLLPLTGTGEPKKKEDLMLMRDATGPAPGGGFAPPVVHEALSESGQPLDGDTRGFMESRLGHDFSRVRIHTSATAAESASAVNARAYAFGPHIVFGPGQAEFGTRRGQWLLAHELAHVAQARAVASPASIPAVEADARQAATVALRGGRADLQQQHDGRRIHCFGEPENVPDLTFISTQGEQGFLNSAVAYHQAWGLAPARINSVEHLLQRLAGATSRLGRIRIVMHAAEIGVYSSLFTNEPRLSLDADRLEAYATSDVTGLAHDVGTWLNLTPSTTTAILTHLRTNHAGMLTPFGIETSGEPAGTLATMFQRATEMQALTQSRTATNAAQADPIISGLRTILADLRQRLQTEAGITAPDAQALENAIRAAGLTFTGITFNADQSRQVAEANRAIAGGFRDTLNAARQRFDADSWIDVRGCNVGDNPDYLRSLSHFFGRPGAQPHVSGPDWFQVFPTLGSQTLANDAAVNAQAGNDHVQTALGRWSVTTGAHSQLEFLRSFYRLEIERRQLAAAPVAAWPFGSSPALQFQPPTLPPLLGGLPTPAADEVATRLLRLPPRLEFSEPAPFGRPSAVTLGLPRWDPMIHVAQSALDRLTEENAELHYYFDAALVLPVYEGPSQQAFRLYMLNALREQAMDNWLGSQWSAAAPGLAALQAGAWSAGDARRVTGLVETHEEDAPAGAEMVVPPDPRYWQHIVRI